MEKKKTRKSRIARVSTKGCGRGYGLKPIKGVVKKEEAGIRESMQTFRDLA